MYIPNTQIARSFFAGVRVHLNSNQAGSTAIAWDAADWDTSGFWSIASPTLLTIPAGLGGKYLIGASVDLAGSPSGDFFLELNSTNKSDPTIIGQVTNSNITSNPLVTVTGTWSFAVGDQMTVRGFGVGTPASITLSGNNDTSAWMIYLSA